MNVYADESGINNIDISVELHHDGSADITEIWEIDNVYDGTEYYKSLYNLEDMSVSDLTVRDDTGKTYETINAWDTYNSFEQKAYKCGILEVDKGYELCWGISELGDRTYTISYHLTGLVKGYTDKAGFYYRFISDSLSSPPDSATITLFMDDLYLSKENASIWALGFEGEINFENGTVVSTTGEALSSDDSINILMSFEDNVFDVPTVDNTFENVKNKAIKGSHTSLFTILGIILAIAAVIFAVFFCLYLLGRNIRLADGTKVHRVSIDEVTETSSIPFLGSIPMACSGTAIDFFTPITTSPIAAYITKWQLSGALTFETKTAENESPEAPIICLHDLPETDSIEQELFGLLQQAANNNSLSLTIWNHWTKENSSKLEKWTKNFKECGDKKLIDRGWALEISKDSLKFTPSGYDASVQMLGFYKYLKGFQNTNGDTNAPREYWGDYLIYASLFNLSDNVMTGLKTMDSHGFDDFCGYYNVDTITYASFMHHSHTLSYSASSSTMDGSGGSSLSSGGDGFSGGGGGGSR